MNVGIYIYEQAEVLDFAGPFEVFSTAARVAGEACFQPLLISEDGDAVKARAGFQVDADHSIDDHPELDLLIVVGGVHTAEMKNERVLSWLDEQAVKVPVVASVCTGAFILAAAGVLIDQQVTTHWEDQADLAEQFPRLQVVSGRRWVDQGARLTSGGISAGIDMSLHLVARFHSRRLAVKTARQMEFDWQGNRPDGK